MDDEHPILRSAAIWLALAASLWVLWYVRVALLVGFGAIIAAMLLRLIARAIMRLTGAGERTALVAATLLVLALTAACAFLFGRDLYAQFGSVMQRVEAGARQLGWAKEIFAGASSLMGAVPVALGSGIAVLESFVVIVIAGIYIAAKPDVYRRGTILLFPRKLRVRAAEALDQAGNALDLWLVGQFIVMVVVGVLSYVGMTAIGLPNPLALALIAAVAEIVPYIGPFAGAIPALLVALTRGYDVALYTLAVYAGIHVLEAYLVAPLLQRRLVKIPPALVLLSIILNQLLFGVAGTVFAAPIALVTFTMVRLLYVRNTLQERMPILDDFTA